MRIVAGRPESSSIPSLPASRRSRWQSTGYRAPDLAERGSVLQGPDDPASTLHEGQPFPASGIEEPLVLCMVSIPPPACRHPAPDRKRSSGMARVFDCGSAESPPIWCRPQHRGAPRQDHPGADAPSEAEDQPITAVQASKGLTHRNIESDSLPFHPCLPAVRMVPRLPPRLAAQPGRRRSTSHVARRTSHVARRLRPGRRHREQRPGRTRCKARLGRTRRSAPARRRAGRTRAAAGTGPVEQRRGRRRGRQTAGQRAVTSPARAAARGGPRAARQT